ncbi:MAG: DUF1211 domain-containing protein [Gammaproteobacteria bacterium]|nr:DUF1211 domain-containing protein [Gammaproteobacteria bacterium]
MDQEYDWDERALSRLPVKKGFRLRGLEMTRLETFADAAFAFAVTMLVISIDTIPGNLEELMLALKGVPAFAASFASIGLIWTGHNRWSRCYGLEDAVTTVLTLALIFIVLVYLYPLKLVFSAFFAWISNGWFPSEFQISSAQELATLFIVYGVGFAAISFIIALLYRHAIRKTAQLALNSLERLYTRAEIVAWTILGSTGVLSALYAAFAPGDSKVFAGFVYFALIVAMPWSALHFERRADELRKIRSESVGEKI